MHSSHIIALIGAIASCSSASPTLPSLLDSRSNAAKIPNGRRLIESTGYINLDSTEGMLTPDGNMTDLGLTKRTPLEICTASTGHYANCLATVAFAGATAFGIASLAKGGSDSHDCSSHTGSVDGVTYEFHASGNHCDTTAEFDTIRGALNKYLSSLDDGLCAVQCLKMEHGGTWVGYATIAPPGENVDSYYCGEFLQYGDCLKGGNNDV